MNGKACCSTPIKNSPHHAASRGKNDSEKRYVINVTRLFSPVQSPKSKPSLINSDTLPLAPFKILDNMKLRHEKELAEIQSRTIPAKRRKTEESKSSTTTAEIEDIVEIDVDSDGDCTAIDSNYSPKRKIKPSKSVPATRRRAPPTRSRKSTTPSKPPVLRRSLPGYPRIILPRQKSTTTASESLLKEAYGDKYEEKASLPSGQDVEKLLAELDEKIEKVHERAVTARCGIQASLAHTRLGQYLRHVSSRFAKAWNVDENPSDPNRQTVFDLLNWPCFREARHLPPRFVDHPTSGNVPNPSSIEKKWITTGSFFPIFNRDKYQNFFISDLQIWASLF